MLECVRPEFRERRLEAHHIGILFTGDKFFVGEREGLGRLYLQPAIGCHSGYVWAELCPSKPSVTRGSADEQRCPSFQPTAA